MPTPADQRLIELLDKWLTSLTLHQEYSSLDDAAYRRVQSWPEHQRPSRWIIDLAKQKTTALKAEAERRIRKDDGQFSDAMEMMAFLANLVGSEHIERFIPLARPPDPGGARADPVDETVEEPIRRGPASEPTRELPSTGSSGTREMPSFARPSVKPAPPVTQAQVTRVERKGAERSGAQASTAEKPKEGGAARSSGQRSTNRPSASDPPGMSADAREQVIADAVRLTQWGRKWYELAELISRMADRPALPDVRRLLKDHKAEIDKMAGR